MFVLDRSRVVRPLCNEAVAVPEEYNLWQPGMLGT